MSFLVWRWWRQQDSSTAIVTKGQSRAVWPWSQVAQTLRKGDVIAIRVRCIKKQPDNRVVGGDNRTRQQRLLPNVNRVQCDLGHSRAILHGGRWNRPSSSLLPIQAREKPYIFVGYSNIGGDNRTRTCDPSHVKRMLYQLSHASKWRIFYHNN